MDNPERQKGGMFRFTRDRASGAPVADIPTKEATPPLTKHTLEFETAVRETFDDVLAPPPTADEILAANAGKLVPRGVSKTLIELSKTLPIRLVLLAGAMGGLKVAADKINEGIHREASADFIKHLTNENTKINPEEIFDNTATKGVKSERNTIQMTREEYDKIAPPAIDRTNAKEVPMTLNIHPQPDGRTTRDLTLELGTAVNAMIYVKTPEGKLRETTYEKITNPGVKGPRGLVFPNCQILVGLEGEIQAGDIFPAPISGRVYYQGDKPTDGINVGGTYWIEGEYQNPETGKVFKATADISTLYALNKPLVENVPYLKDFIQDTSWNYAVKKMPIITVQQGQDLFKFITISPGQEFRNYPKTKSQLVVSTSYQGDFGENGIANTFAGENCNHPTVDNKAIVLK